MSPWSGQARQNKKIALKIERTAKKGRQATEFEKSWRHRTGKRGRQSHSKRDRVRAREIESEQETLKEQERQIEIDRDKICANGTEKE